MNLKFDEKIVELKLDLQLEKNSEKIQKVFLYYKSSKGKNIELNGIDIPENGEFLTKIKSDDRLTEKINYIYQFFYPKIYELPKEPIYDAFQLPELLIQNK